MKTSYKHQAKLLDTYIDTLKIQKDQDFMDLSSQFNQTLDYYRPVNILNRTIKDVTETPAIRTNLFDALLGITGGYFSKRLFMGKSTTLTKRIFGYALQYTITNIITKKVSEHSINK